MNLLLTPAAIESAQEWVGTKIQGPADVASGAVALAAIYKMKVEIQRIESPLCLALKELVRCVRGGDETAGFSMDDALIEADEAIERFEAPHA